MHVVKMNGTINSRLSALQHLGYACSKNEWYNQLSPVSTSALGLPYFFDYKTGVFSFQNNPKDLDPSCKMDLDLWDCLGMGKIGIIAKFHRTDLVI